MDDCTLRLLVGVICGAFVGGGAAMIAIGKSIGGDVRLVSGDIVHVSGTTIVSSHTRADAKTCLACARAARG
ncbi:MAG: hypothetical protein NVSMB21_25470 [Vulcanimicrobiaceae bacterium]